MSSDIRVPDSRVESFLTLSRMSVDAYKELFSQTAKIQSSTYSDQFIHQLSSESKLTPKNDFAEVIKTILSLFPPMISSRKSVNAFIKDLMMALTANVKVDDSLTQQNFETLEKRLIDLLKIPSLSVNAKAVSVYFENAKSYISSRVLSDVRPVFGLEDDSVSGMVLVHTLKLEYVEDSSDTKEIYLAMDEGDIDDLISKLEREKIKIKKIKTTLANGQINIIDLDDK